MASQPTPANQAYKTLASALLLAGVVALVAALGSFLVAGFFSNPTKILVIVGAGLLVGYVLLAPGTVLSAFTSRGAKYGANSTAMTVLFVAIIVAGNWFTNGHSPSFDLTANKLFTLSPVTKQLLKDLPQPVEVTAFYRAGGFQEQRGKELLERYASQSGNFHYKVVDPDREPLLAQQFEIAAYDTLVFQSAGNRRVVTSSAEEDFTSALLSITSTQRRKVYFVTGNGQPSPADSSRDGFHDAQLALEQNNYVVATLDATTATVPDDAAAVILAAPTQPMSAGQKKSLTDYLQKGGKMLVMGSAFAEVEDLNAVLKPVGLQFLPGVTLDIQSSAGSPQIPAVSSYQDPRNEVVRNLATTLFPLPGAVQATQPAPTGVTTAVLARTTENSWLQNRRDQIAFRDGDQRGPLNLIVTAEGTLPPPPPDVAALATPGVGGPDLSLPGALPSGAAVATLPPTTPTAVPTASGTPQANAQPTATATPIPAVSSGEVNFKGGTRVIAIASSLWMTGQFLNVPGVGNHDLLMNAVNHLIGNTALIGLPSKDLNPGQLFLLSTDRNLIWVVTAGLLPLLAIVVGAVVWFQRR